MVQAHRPVFGSVKLAPMSEKSFVPRHMKSDGLFSKSIHRETTLKTALEILDYSVKIRSQVYTITCAILPRNQSPSVSNSQRGRSCEPTTFLNPGSERTHCMEIGQTFLFSSRLTREMILPHTGVPVALLSLRKNGD